MINKLKTFEVDKKMVLKVVAGVMLLAIAFCFYLAKNISVDEEITYSDIPNDEIGNIGIISDEAILIKTNIIIDVAGAVEKPSVVDLPIGSRVYEAINLAGGFTKDADTKYINLAKVLVDGEKLYIPTQEELKSAEGIASNVGNQNILNYSNTQPSLININTADSNTLQKLTGVGPSTAEKIINYRLENGNFKNIEDLKNVSGIGDKTFEKLKNKITV